MVLEDASVGLGTPPSGLQLSASRCCSGNRSPNASTVWQKHWRPCWDSAKPSTAVRTTKRILLEQPIDSRFPKSALEPEDPKCWSLHSLAGGLQVVVVIGQKRCYLVTFHPIAGLICLWRALAFKDVGPQSKRAGNKKETKRYLYVSEPYGRVAIHNNGYRRPLLKRLCRPGLAVRPQMPLQGPLRNGFFLVTKMMVSYSKIMVLVS